MRRMLVVGIGILLAAWAAGPSRADPTSTEPDIAHLERISAGMTVAETAVALERVPGIKQARADGDTIRIAYRGGGVRIADVPFQVRPTFVDGRLDQLWLFSGDRCSTTAVATFAALARQLGQRFPTGIDGTPLLTQAEVNAAAQRSLAESKKQQIGAAMTAGDKVAVVNAYVWRERPDIAPSYGVYNERLWTPGQTIHRSRAKECNGNGFGRVDYELGFMTRATYDGLQATTATEQPGG